MKRDFVFTIFLSDNFSVVPAISVGGVLFTLHETFILDRIIGLGYGVAGIYIIGGGTARSGQSLQSNGHSDGWEGQEDRQNAGSIWICLECNIYISLNITKSLGLFHMCFSPS